MTRWHSRKLYRCLFCFAYLVNFIFVVSVIVQTQRPLKCDPADYKNCGEATQNLNLGFSSRKLNDNDSHSNQQIGPPSPLTFTGPAWDFSEEYSSINDSRIEADLTLIDSNILSLNILGSMFYVNLVDAKENMTVAQAESHNVIDSLEQMHDLNINSIVLLKNLNTFALCISSTDNGNKEHNKLWAKLGMLGKRISFAYEPASTFLEHCTDEVLDLFFSKSESTAASKFDLLRSRSTKKHSLSPSEDEIISSYSEICTRI